jgi:DNA modification methylase
MNCRKCGVTLDRRHVRPQFVVMCGDSTSSEDVGRLMGRERAGLCFTSPPYAQQRDYGAKIADWDALMRGVFGTLRMADDGQVLVNLGLIHRDGEVDLYWSGFLGWMREQSWRLFGWYVWDKLTPTFKANDGRLWVSHEWVFHFNRAAVPCVEWVPCEHAGERRGRWGQRKADGHVAELATPGKIKNHRPPDSVARIQRETNNSDAGVRSHPARFPVDLPAFYLQTFPGAVFDPFLGSGTTVVAAKQLGRRCFGMEIEPKYVAVALQRLSDMGLAPTKEDA